MKESLCSPINRRNGYHAIAMATVLSLSGCVGPGKRFFASNGTLDQSALQSPSSLSGQETLSSGIPSSDSLDIQPETHADDLATQVNTPVLPTQESVSTSPVGYDLSQPVDPQTLMQSNLGQDAVGSGMQRTIRSPYYTKPTRTSNQEIQGEPESVYQLLEGLEPGVSDAEVPAADTMKPYVARQFPQTGEPLLAQRRPNAPPQPPAPGTRLPNPPKANPNNAPDASGLGVPPAANPPAGLDPYTNTAPSYSGYQGPRIREADLIINGFPARTGRMTLGGAVNSDAGITGQLTIDERNFDITRWPTSFRDMFSGTAFRGAGQTFRLEAAPGSVFKRYTLQFADPNLLGYLPISMSVSGFLYDRRFNDWDEERMGGRLSFGYRITPDLSISAGVTGQNVDITDARDETVLADILGDNGLWSGEVSLKHDTRNTPIQASEGHYLEFSFEEVFGDYEYSRFELEARQYWLLNERVDGSGKQTLSFSSRLGFSGKDTPIFENFFAGGYATMRGFEFRGASPETSGIEVGGRFQWLNTLEYMFPLTADDAFAGVAFVDFGTVERNIEISGDNFRVAPGAGLRVAIPMLGPAPLAFDFAFPVAKADTDDERIFSFYMSMVR